MIKRKNQFTSHRRTTPTSTAHARSAPAATSTTALVHIFEHGRVFQHVGQDEEANLRAPDVHVLQLRHAAVAMCHCDFGHVAIHVVFGFDQLASIHLT